MSTPTAYRMSSYGNMISGEPRMSAYADALRAAITPGCRVIDIGAGTGIFSILACRYGAGSVVAIEPDNVVDLLPQMALDNGCRDRIVIFKGLSTDYRGPGDADVIISDIRGCLPLFEGHIKTIVDARQRLLAATGCLIPARDTLRVAIVHNPKDFRPIESPWLSNQFGIDLSAGHPFAANEWSKVELLTNDMLSEPQDLANLDYRTISDPNLVAEASLPVARSGLAHGLIIWFDAELGSGYGFSNAPGQPPQIYGQTFFPFERAVQLSTGDRVEVEFKANLIDGSYVYSWNSSVWRSHGDKPEATFRQSSFRAKVTSPRDLERRSSHYVPPIHAGQEFDVFCLRMIDGQTSLGDVADRLRAQFPDRFGTAKLALNYVAQLTERYHPRGGRIL